MSCHDCHKAGGWHLPLFSVAPKALSAVCLNGLKDFKGFKVLSGPTRNRRPRHSVAPPLT